MAPRQLHLPAIVVAIAVLCGAQDPAQPPDQPGKPESCPTVFTPWLDIDALHSTADFRAARDGLIAQFVSLRAYHGCLNAGINALIARWKTAGAKPNRIVIDSVTSRIRDGQERYATAVARFNGAAHHYDRRFDKTDSDYVPELGSGDVPVPAAATAPEHLNLVAYGLLRLHGCPLIYPPEAAHLLQSGETEITFDVSADGALQNVRISKTSGHDDMDAAALACVSTHWRYAPAVVDDVPVASPGRKGRIGFSMEWGHF